ncbi:hypothetical protein TNCV_4920321 [Trichonephila clavipes]|nr:hypothetical protein TNCV_4920321 [Trichonephila clavipes]
MPNVQFLHKLTKWQQYLEMQLLQQFSVEIISQIRVDVGNENPDARLESKAIRHHSSNNQYSYEVSEIQIQILVLRPKHPMPTFGIPTPTSSVPKREGDITLVQHYPVRSLEFQRYISESCFPPRKIPRKLFSLPENS